MSWFVGFSVSGFLVVFLRFSFLGSLVSKFQSSTASKFHRSENYLMFCWKRLIPSYQMSISCSLENDFQEM